MEGGGAKKASGPNLLVDGNVDHVRSKGMPVCYQHCGNVVSRLILTNENPHGLRSQHD